MSVEFVSASQVADAAACDAPLRLVDTFGRVARDLRVSLTDRCNLRCHYCMPPEGLPWLEDERLLTDDEIVRLVAERAPSRDTYLAEVTSSVTERTTSWSSSRPA